MKHKQLQSHIEMAFLLSVNVLRKIVGHMLVSVEAYVDGNIGRSL